MVNQYFTDLYSHLQFNSKLQYNWKIPNFIYDNKKLILDYLLPIGILSQYQIYHDIGKPYCKTYDLYDNSKYHFPNHAAISGKKYKELTNNELISLLILRDMDIHTIKAKDIPTFLGESTMDHNIAISLLLTGLSEIHANAEMFGGIDSTSFKIKYKQIESRGKQIIKQLKEQL